MAAPPQESAAERSRPSEVPTAATRSWHGLFALLVAPALALLDLGLKAHQVSTGQVFWHSAPLWRPLVGLLFNGSLLYLVSRLRQPLLTLAATLCAGGSLGQTLSFLVWVKGNPDWINVHFDNYFANSADCMMFAGHILFLTFFLLACLGLIGGKQSAEARNARASQSSA